LTRYFTHYWSGTTCSEVREQARDGDDRLDQAASKQFCKRHVRIGDYVYAVNIRAGRMMVLGRMRVAKITPGKKDQDDFWDAYDQVNAEDGTATLLNFTRKVKPKTAKSLRFLTSSGEEHSLVFSKEDSKLLDSQTLRGVRRLTEESAELLDRAVGLNPRLQDHIQRKAKTKKPRSGKIKTSFSEGGIDEITCEVKHRDPALKPGAIAKYGYGCMVCNFNFLEAYGDAGEGYIELHHLKPISKRKGKHTVTVEEVIVVCANCHRVLHKNGATPIPWKDLRRIVRRQRARKAEE